MVTTALRGLAFACCFVVAAVQLAYDPVVYSYAHYLGALMIFAAMAIVAVAILLVWGNHIPALERAGWALGGFVMVAVLGGYIASRTVGLVDYRDPHWVWPGTAAMVAAAVYLLAYAATVLGRGGRMAPYPSDGAALFEADRVPELR